MAAYYKEINNTKTNNTDKTHEENGEEQFGEELFNLLVRVLNSPANREVLDSIRGEYVSSGIC